MSTPLVSVVLPTYNRARFLGESIQSALRQTYPHLEVVVVDDGSRDDTPELLRTLAAADPRVRWFRQENQGVSAARNHALAQARGELVAFLDSDDVWLPWKLQLQTTLLAACPHVGMTWTDMDAVHPDGSLKHRNFLRQMYSAYRRFDVDTLLPRQFRLGELSERVPAEHADCPVHTGHIYSRMFHGNLVHTPTVLLRREWADRVGPFDTSMLRGGEDFKYHLATCRLGEVAFLDVASIRYRVGSGDHLTNRENNLHFARAYLRTIQEELSAHRDCARLSDKEVAHILAGAHEWLAEELIAHDDHATAVTHALRSIWLGNRWGRNWKTLFKTLIPRRMIPLLNIGRRRPAAA